MKIERISFENINSFKGKHSIDFSKDPLGDAGIFAILGPTGSGKSTVLDVITLALFNRIPRFSKAISKNEIEGNGSVLTHFTQSAYASIEYSTGKGAYISEWKVRRARTGNLKDHEMFIFDKNEGKYLDLKKSEVPGMNEVLIGLSYDQFSKSIILSQGQFSKFLKADKNERGLLLEKITGTGIYRKIGARVYEKFRQLKQDIEQQQSNSEFIEVLEEQERARLEKDLVSSDEKIIKIEKAIAILAENIKAKSQIKELLAQKDKTKQDITELLQRKVKVEISNSKLVQYEKISHLRGDIALFTEAKKKLQDLEQYLVSVKRKIDFNSTELQKVISKMSQLSKAEVTEQSFMQVMATFESQIKDLFNDRESKKIEGAKVRAKIKNKCDAQAFAIALELVNEKRPETALTSISTRQEVLKDILSQAQLNLKTQSHEITDLVNKRNRSIELLKEELLHSQELEKAIQAQEKNTKVANDLRTNLESITPKLKDHQDQLVRLKQHLKETQKNKDNSLALFKLNDYRAALVDGESCPLCGSKEHPLAGHTEKDNSHFDKEIKKTEAGIEVEQKNIQKIDQLIIEAKTQLNTLSVDSQERAIVIAKHQTWFNDNQREKQDEEVLNKQILQLEQEIAAFNSSRASLEEHKWLSDIKIEFEALQEAAEAYREKDKLIKEKYSGDDVVADCNQLQNEFGKYSHPLEKDKLDLKRGEQDLLDLKQKINSLDTSLSPKIISLGFNKIEEVKQSFLNEDQVEQLKREKENYDRQKISLETQEKSIALALTKLQDSVSDIKPSLDELNENFKSQEVQRNSLLQEKGANTTKLLKDDENIKKLKVLNQKLAKQKQAFEIWQLLNAMIGDRTGNTFSNYAQNVTLQTLLVHANRRMQNLYKRYLLAMPKDSGELIIIDTYQGNTERGVSTLSGGETFIVSLALALSLSDMASKNVALESLFIDEGFSTLDPEMLDLAMITLDKIQSESQKTVGIISHVESLKERIAVQIQLEKNAQGFSSIQLIS